MKILYTTVLVLISNLVFADSYNDAMKNIEQSNYYQCLEWCKFSYEQATNNFCRKINDPSPRGYDYNCTEQASKDYSRCVDLCERKRY